MESNILTMGICAPHDLRQAIGAPYTIPSPETRLLRAKLILEEALETIHALGCYVDDSPSVYLEVDAQPDLEGIIDGCCDLNYVLTGTLVSCGVPDAPHIEEVCAANERKFPGGVAAFNSSGKFLKPADWVGPDHAQVRKNLERVPST